MEVHAHTHTPRKKWTHYFWEFFMLFLAVTLGFFVENMREHQIETKREKALMQALLSDLRADQQQIDSLIQKRMIRNTHCDSLIQLLTSGDKKNGVLQYFYGRNASRRIHFRPQDGTLQQLRNSGGFRVVHNASVLNGINAYELSLKNNFENIEVEEKELTEYTAFAAKIFEVKIFQEMTKKDGVEKPAGNPLLLSYDKVLMNELCMRLHYWKRTSVSALDSWKKLRKDAIELINLVKKEYHLK